VIEYYRPRAEFAGKVKAQVNYEEDTKQLTFEFPDGSLVTGKIMPGKSKFIEDVPYAKSYNEGQKRWWIESSSNNGKFDKRKPVGQPKDQTGEYYTDEMQEARGSAPRPDDGMNMGRKPVKPVVEWGGPDGGHFYIDDQECKTTGSSVDAQGKPQVNVVCKPKQ
jgi:hypothetical protein